MCRLKVQLCDDSDCFGPVCREELGLCAATSALMQVGSGVSTRHVIMAERVYLLER